METVNDINEELASIMRLCELARRYKVDIDIDQIRKLIRKLIEQ